MEEKIAFRDIWRAASLGGIVLAAISTAYMLFDNKINGLEGGWVLPVRFVVDLLKIFFCIYTLRLFLIRFKDNFEKCTREDLWRVGRWTAFLSALIFATANMAYFTWHPEVVSETFKTVMTTFGDKLDANSLSKIEMMENSFPTFAFVSQLIYCYLFGMVISAILSSRIMNRNPFIE